MKSLFVILILLANSIFVEAQIDTLTPIELREGSLNDQVFTICEVMPEYGEGGSAALMKFLSKNIKYPDYSMDNGLEGTVYISFVVNKEGSLEDIRPIREVSGAPDLTLEAIRVIKLTEGKWKPGMQNGKLVKVNFNLPIKFKLQ